MRPKPIRYLLAAASLLACSASLAHAATFTWEGPGTILNDNVNWSPDYDNSVAPTFSWNGTVAGPLALTVNAVFGPTGAGNGTIWNIGSNQTSSLTVTNSSGGVSRNLQFNNGQSLIIAADAGAFTLGGSGDAMQIRLANGSLNYSFTNNSANKAIFGSNVSFNRDVGTANTNLFFSGTGDQDVLGNIQVLGTGSVNKTGAGTLTLGGANTFGGLLLIQNGTVVFSALNNLGSGTSAIRLGQTTTSGTLLYDGASDVTIDRQINIGNGADAAHVGSSTIQNDSLTGNLTFGNATFNVAGTADIFRSLTLRGTNTGNNLISGSIVDNLTANGTVSLIKRDSGTWNLTGENTFSRGLQIWEGVLEFDGNGSLGAQTIQTRIGRTSTSGTLRHTGGSNTIVTGQVQVGFGAGGTGNATIESTGVGTLSFNNATFNNAEGAANAHRTLTLGGNNTGANTISGAIVNNNNASAIVSIAKSGAGTWNLTGNNTYTGDTTLNEGLLTSLNTVSIASGSTLRFNGGSISVNGGAGYIHNSGTMDVNGQTITAGSYEASPFWAPNAKLVNSSTNAATILGWTGSAMKNTIWINATGAIIETVGNLTISSIVTDGASTHGFTKTGNGTLFLTNLTDYQGNTTISAGTLSMSYPSLSDNSTVTINGGTLNLNFIGEDQVDKAFALLGGFLLTELSPGVYGSGDGVGITGTGELRVGPPPAAGYSAWAASFTAPVLSDTASTADPDNDGLINAVEYALGLDPRFSSPSPGVITNNGKTITFTKGALAKVDPKVTYEIETSISLGVLPTPWTVNVANVTPTPDTIAITFPVGPVKNFARLKVTLAP